MNMSKDITVFSDTMNFISINNKMNVVVNNAEKEDVKNLVKSDNIDYDKGFSAGWSECEQKMLEDIKALQAQLEDVTNSIPNNLKKYFDELESQVKHEVANFAIKISEIILKRELTLKDDIQPLIDDILAPLTTLENVKLYLNPEVITNIKENQEPVIPNSIEIVFDANLMYGEARLECEQGIIDATLPERLKTAKEVLEEKFTTIKSVSS